MDSKGRRGTLTLKAVESGESGVTRPTISSARRSSVCPIGLGLRTEDLGIKPLPALQLHRRKGPPVCAKLCDTMHRSTAGHVFELSSARERYPFLEYNSLHDPHLKSYFYHPQMKEKLINNGFVTKDLHVICRSLKEYNAYRNFLESEFMKLYKAKEDAVNEKERRAKSIETETQQRRQSNIEREEKRKQFFKQQEKKLRAKEIHLRRREKQEHMAKMKMLEERRMQRERNEIKREAEREQRKLRQLKKEYEEASMRQSLLRQCEADERIRQIHLTQVRKEEKMKHLRELERRWQKYEEHAQKAKEEHEAKLAEEKEDRERRIRKREKIFQLLRKREEERQAKLHEENHHQVEQLKELADNLEKKWQKVKENGVWRWKETIQKKRNQWDQFVSQQKEIVKKEQEKHIGELLNHSHLPSVTTPTGWVQRKSASSRPTSQEKPQTPSTTVRFTTKPTVHIIEDSLSEESSLGVEGVQLNSDTPVIDIEDDLSALTDGDQECGRAEEQALEAELLDLDHRDSYDIQVEKRRDSEGSGKMDNETETLEAVEKKSSMDLSHVLEQTGCAAASKTSLGEVSVTSQLEHSVDTVSPTAVSPLPAGDSVSTLLSQQRSTASDVVSKVLERAVGKYQDQ